MAGNKDLDNLFMGLDGFVRRIEETEDIEAEEAAQDSGEISARIKILKKKAQDLPHKSGVYVMKNKAGKIIYIGKAKFLANRVSQYFVFYPHRDFKTNKLVENIADFDFIVTGNEIEALILENQQIKLHAPKYNIKLKDGKNYPYLRINIAGEYPVLSIVRSRVSADKALYFGPYSSKGSIFKMIDEINKNFRLPVCKNEFPRDIKKKRPCLNHRIDRCMGVCAGGVSSEEYKGIIDSAVMFIKGEYKDIIKKYSADMQAASDDLDFEKAAGFRDKILALEKLRSKQKIVAAPEVDEDVFGVYIGDTSSCISIFNIRYGAIIDKETEHFAYDEILDEDGFLQYMQSYYTVRDSVPRHIVSSIEISEENISLIESWLGDKAGRKVKLICPKKGEHKVTADLAVTNAREAQRVYREKYSRDVNKLALVAKSLGLEALPQRIESFDVSNSGGENITCGMIVVEDGNFRKGDYKSFNIKQGQADDYAAMGEAVRRRFENYLELAGVSPENGFAKLPDLILLDGGKGHVSAIKKVLHDFDNRLIAGVPVFGMVKDEYHKTRGLTDGEREINIAKDQGVFVFFYKIQEEVHRYALRRMDIKRRKTVKQSVLHDIKGLGDAKIKKLFEHFKSIDEIKQAGADELVKVKGLTRANAESIVAYFAGVSEGESR